MCLDCNWNIFRIKNLVVQIYSCRQALSVPRWYSSHLKWSFIWLIFTLEWSISFSIICWTQTLTDFPDTCFSGSGSFSRKKVKHCCLPHWAWSILIKQVYLNTVETPPVLLCCFHLFMLQQLFLHHCCSCNHFLLLQLWYLAFLSKWR